jgi:Tfp pilus assembly protein PilF
VVSGDRRGWGPPDYPDLERLAGLIARQRWSEVELGARQTIERYPAWEGGFQKLSLALLNLRRLDEAREAVDAAARLAPDDDWNLTQVSWIAQRQRDLVLARDAATRAVAMAPTKARPHRRLAQVLLQKTSGHPQSTLDPASALEAADRALSIEHDDPEHHRLRAQSLEALGRRSEAIEAFREAIRLAPDAHHDLNNLGRAYLRHRPFMAARLFRRSAQLDPTCPNPRSNLTPALHSCLHQLTCCLALAGVVSGAAAPWLGTCSRLAIICLGLAAVVTGIVAFCSSVPTGALRAVAQRSWGVGLVHAGLLLVVLATDAVIVWGDPLACGLAMCLLLTLAVARVAVHQVPAFYPVARRLGTWMVPRARPRSHRPRLKHDVSPR